MESVNTLLAEAEKYKQLMLSINKMFASGDMLEV
jgi:hypothetical protein